jgi:prepilin-type N-terminal cleavage/methylation domain-containing protein
MIRSRSGCRRGFTLTELLVVIGIVAILSALILPNFSSILGAADRPICTARLKNLWSAFSTHLQDGNGWPQLPPGVQIGSTAEQQWWISMSSNTMGLTLKDWRCPSYARALKHSTNSQQQPYLISYLPTLFDPRPLTPKKWARMPWFTEVTGFHGGGNLSIRSDGSVCPAKDR